ncbi:MAG TPA: hypothetical protein PK886_00265 [Candidatus Paceibacterota bacterium]|nr:hypothetical protein [Candidatus Paceibacterota bacterium]
MINEPQSPQNQGFGGIFTKLKQVVFTEEYLEATGQKTQKTEINPNSTVLKPTTSLKTENVTVSNGNENYVKEMVEKVYSFLEKVNKPGIDFMELWNAAEKMGGVTEQNLQNAFTALKIATGDTLTTDELIRSGKSYKTEINKLIESNIKEKQNERLKILSNQESEKSNLETEITDTAEQIEILQKSLNEKREKLASIDARYKPEVLNLENKISAGSSALNFVNTEMQSVIDLISKIKF